MSMMRRIVLTVGVVSVAWLGGGCGEGPFDVEVSLAEGDPKLKDEDGTVRSIEVNLVAVNDTEKPVWEQVSMSEYWEPGNAIRDSAAKHVMTFGQGFPKTQVLKKKNAIWRTWLRERQAKHLFILADLPWIQQDKPGDADPRRLILPLEVGKWEWYLWGADTIKIQVSAGGLTSLRQPKKQ